MNNTVDFYIPQNNKLAVRAAFVNVYMDGILCDYINVGKIVYATNPEFGSAILNCDLLEKQRTFYCGQKIIIKTLYNDAIGKAVSKELIIFSGFIEKIFIEENCENQQIKLTAADYSCKLKNITIYGQNITDSNGECVFLTGAETVFNADSLPNRAKKYNTFTDNQNSAEMFTCAQAIYYLLKNYIADKQVKIPSIELLENITQGVIVTDLDVEGQSLIQAIDKCCKCAGINFKIVSDVLLDRSAIVFFKQECGRRIELNSQLAGEKLNISKTNISKVSRQKNMLITNRYVVQGDYKIYEATFNLIKAWDASLEDNDYDKFSPLTNENFSQVKNVWRKWCLNEAGDYTQNPFNQGSAFDFSKIFEGQKYVQKRRRFSPCISTDLSGSSLGYKLEISYTNGSKWWPAMCPFQILLDQCGIRLSAEQLDTDIWFAAIKGYLKVRITASVISDSRIKYVFADGTVNSMVPTREQVITCASKFKYKKVSPYSILKNNYPAKQVDDTAYLVQYAKSLAKANRRDVENIKIETLLSEPFVEPGDILTLSPDSRDVLGIKYQNDMICTVKKVELDYAKQITVITAIKQRLQNE